jgi:hypothetical protein
VIRALSLSEAFDIATRTAPGVSGEVFLTQTLEHLRSGRIRATGFPCVIKQGDEPQTMGELSFAPRSADRREIAAEEWRDLRLDLDAGGFASFTADGAPQWLKSAWETASFDGEPVLTDIRLLIDDEALGGLWVEPRGDKWSDERIMDWLKAQIEEFGGEHISKRAFRQMVVNVRRNVRDAIPPSDDEKIWNMLGRLQGPRKAGRPAKAPQ